MTQAQCHKKQHENKVRWYGRADGFWSKRTRIPLFIQHDVYEEGSRVANNENSDGRVQICNAVGGNAVRGVGNGAERK